MRLRDYIDADGSITWTSPLSPVGQDFQDVHIGLTTLPQTHPPSLKNPKKVKIPYSDDGWRKGSTKEERKQAIQDLFEIIKRTRRQIGKPEVAITAPMPVFPDIQHWF